MARIGASLSGIERRLLNRLAESDAAATLNTLRLAAGKRILAPRDDVSAFATLSGLQTRLSTVTATMSNVTSANSLISQTQSAVAQIRAQLELIQTELFKDENQTLDASERAEAQARIDAAIAEINALSTTSIDGRRTLDGSAAYSVQGQNSSQVSRVTIYSKGTGGPTVVGRHAELTYTGTNRYVTADATLEISGNVGSTTIATTTSDTLEDLAAKINERSQTTGVTAAVDGNTLTFASAEIGAGESVSVQVTAGTFAVSGGNGDGTADGADTVYGSEPAIAGRVVEAATRAELTYTGTAGGITVGDGGTLTVTGEDGSAEITVADAEALTDVAVKINNVSHQTGVFAEVSGDTLTFSSVEYGSQASASVTADSAFSVTGGYDDGEAFGTDMIAEIGGIRYAPAESPQLRHREATGLITADATVTVTGELGSANIGITTGQGLATVAAAINAQQNSTGIVARVDGVDLVLESRLTGASSSVAIEVTAGSFTTVEDYTAATAAELTYTGADGKLVGDVSFDLTGTGTESYSFNDGDTLASIRDAINLDSGSTGVEATVQGDQLVLRSVATGSAASIALTNVVGSFDLTGGNGDGTANGTNAAASTTGADASTPHATLRGNQLTVNRNGTHFQIEFAQGFAGQFNTMTIGDGGLSFAMSTDLHYRSSLSLPGLASTQLGGISGRLSDLLTGGSATGLANNTSHALRIVEEALGQVDVADGIVSGFYNSSVATSNALLDDLKTDLEEAISETDGFDEDEENVLLAKNQGLASNALAGLAIMYQQRHAIIDLIRQAAGLDG
ncbi:MAG: hypothetical protein GXX96_07355 [Planctomycetaceae bacterium]|nr:hypothetical protein [Planctomycetaceae bacterium]